MSKPGEPIPVAPELLARVLRPYKPHCRYVKSAVVRKPADAGPDGPVAVMDCELEIPESCYIDDTGHFNAVEFNICVNQMYYLLTTQCVASGLAPALAGETVDGYIGRMLPDVLIHSFRSLFTSPMSPRRFTGRLTFDAVTAKKRYVHFKTSVVFEGPDGGHSEGEVTLVLLHRTASDPHHGGSRGKQQAGT
jgi:hypothetical protein